MLKNFQVKSEIIDEITGVNETFDKTFTIDTIIGEGSSGYILKAFINQNDQNVAIKYLRKSSHLYKNLTYNQFKHLILEEIIIHFNSIHNNICRNIGYFNIGENYAMIMQICERGTISDVCRNLRKNNNPASEPLVGYIVFQLIQALKFLKSISVVHFDIKKENVLVDQNFEIKLSDFSIAKRINKSNKSFCYAGCGTGYYISPENMNCEEVNVEDVFKSDLYSLGVLMYKLAFNQSPYKLQKGDSRKEMLYKISKNHLQFPENVRVSDEFRQCVSALLEKDVKKRLDLSQLVECRWVKNLENIFEVKERYTDAEKFISDLGDNNIFGYEHRLNYNGVVNSKKNKDGYFSVEGMASPKRCFHSEKEIFALSKRKLITIT